MASAGKLQLKLLEATIVCYALWKTLEPVIKSLFEPATL